MQVAWIDRMIGRLRARLEDTGLWDRTLLVRSDAGGRVRGRFGVPPAPARMLVVAALREGAEDDAPLAYDAAFIGEGRLP